MSAESELSDPLKAAQRDAKRLAGLFDAIAKLKPSSAGFTEKLATAIDALPPADALVAAIGQIRSAAENRVRDARANRESIVRSVEADFVNGLRKNGAAIREVSDGWRIGEMQLELKRTAGQARLLYNREVVIPWQSIGSVSDLDRLVTDARGRLARYAIPDPLLTDLLSSALDCALSNSKSQTKSLVPLPELYKEFRVAQVRRTLAGKPDRKLEHAEFPRFAFLYNLDRYRLMTGPRSGVLTLETGSQSDVQRGIGMVLNGLEATADYRTYCYARRGTTE